MKKGGRKPTAEELKLWRAAVGEPDPAKEAPAAPKEANADGSSDLGRGLRRPPAPTVLAAPGGVDPNIFRAIRRRRLPVEDSIDLHGMTQAMAHVELLRFLRDRAGRRMKCVLVITGKGGRSGPSPEDAWAGREVGVLRDSLPRWLTAPEFAEVVIGTSVALPRDGDDGARYVLLRRPR